MSATFPRSLTPEDLGKRVLVTAARWTQIYYTRVAEFSPSGRYVQFRSDDTDMMDPGWIATDQVSVMEVLPERNSRCPVCGYMRTVRKEAIPR